MTFDLIVAGFVALAAGFGAWKGFAWQVGAVAAPVAGIGAGWPLSASLSPHLSLSAPLDRWVAFGILYLLISLLAHLAALAIRRALERARLASWDRHAGFVLGGLKGFALATLLTAASLAVFAGERDRVRATRVGGLMAGVVRAVGPALPPGVRDAVGPVLDSFRAPASPTSAVTVKKRDF
jgi:membrane protein required for colicin V production